MRTKLTAVAARKALIEEAQRQARLPRQRNTAVVLLVLLAALAASYAGGSGAGGGRGTVR